MRRVLRSALLALCAAGASTAAAAGPVTYRLDPAHTFATFEVLHFGTSTLRGRIGPIDGEALLDRAAGTGEVRLTIPMGTVDTGVRLLDARLREPDLLATAEHPVAYFIATKFKLDAAGQVAEVRGEFIVRGVSEALSLVATHFHCHEHPQLHREVCGGDFEGEFKRSVFGATFGLPFVADRVRLLVQVEGIREP